MRILGISIFLVSIIAAGSTSAQAQHSLTNWTVECVKYISRGEKIPCDNLNSSGDTFNFHTRMIVGNDQKTSTAKLTFVKKDNQPRTLKTLEVTPSRDPNNTSQQYWFEGSKGGQKAARSNKRQFVQLMFVGDNYRCRPGTRDCVVPEGEYNGTMKVQDTVSGDVFTINLSVQVVWPKKKT